VPAITGRPLIAVTSSAQSIQALRAAAREVLVSPRYGTDRIFGAPIFGLTGKSKRNLINALK
jgi:hypothetical protein